MTSNFDLILPYVRSLAPLLAGAAALGMTQCRAARLNCKLLFETGH